jgi:hypothetical protein
MRSGDRLTTTHLSPNIRTSPRIAGRRDLAAAAGSGDSTGKPPPQRFGTATKAATSSAAVVGQPRQCILHKGKKGFGFVLRGAKVGA